MRWQARELEVDRLTSRTVMRVAAEYFGTTLEALRARKTPREARARQVAMYVCRERLRMSYPQIGQLFGRDHTTVIAAVKNVQAIALADAQAVLEQLAGEATPKPPATCEHCGQSIDRGRALAELQEEFKRLQERLELLSRLP